MFEEAFENFNKLFVEKIEELEEFEGIPLNSKIARYGITEH